MKYFECLHLKHKHMDCNHKIWGGHHVSKFGILYNVELLMLKYLNHSKTKEKPIYFFEFLSLIREKLEWIINVAAIVGRNAEPWPSVLLEV